MKKLLSGLFLAGLLWPLSNINAQCTQQVIWNNPSFEGAVQPHLLPGGWSNCNGTTSDTQPGNWGIGTPASNGSTYAGLVSTSGWEETASQSFSPCLNAGQTFQFTVDLIKLDETSDYGGDCDGWLELWGGNATGSACDQDELLWTSPIMTTGGPFQNVWNTVTMSFTPSQTTCQLTFIAKGGTCYGSGNFYMGMDNLGSITPSINGSPTVNNNVSCNGGNNGSATVAVSGGASPYSFSWTGGYTGQTVSNLPAGTYTVNITDANGCPGSTVVTVTQPPVINVGLTPVSATCGQADGSISTSVSGGSGSGYTFSWSPSGGSAQNPTGLSAGNYTVNVQDGNGCSTSSVTAVSNTGSVNSPFSVNSATQCLNGNSFSFTNSGSSGGGVTQTWDFGDGVGTSTAVNASYTYGSAGTYTVTHTVSQGICNSITTTVVTVLQDPDANAGTAADLTCLTTNVTLDGSTSTGGAVLTWNGPGLSNATDPATANSAGTYTLTSTNGSCVANATIVINSNTQIPDAQIASSVTVIDCANQSATLTGSSATSGSTLLWSGPSGSISGNPITVNAAGTYTLTVIDPVNGCTNSQTQSITSNGSIPTIGLNASDDTLTCLVTSITLTGGSTTGGVTLDWAGPSGALSGNPVTTASAGTYTLTVTDPSNNCSVTQTVTIASNTTVPTANASASQPTINCTTTSSDLSGSTNASNATVGWTGSSGALSGNPVNITSAGTYTFSVVDNSNGCTASQTVTVGIDTVTPPVSLTPNNPVINCTNSTVVLTAVTSGNVNYGWTDPGGLSTTTTQTITATSGGTYSVLVTNPSNGCTNTASINVTSDIALPNADAGLNDTLPCGNGSLSLNGTSTTTGVNYSWSGPSGFTSTSANPSITSAGQYILTVTDPSNNCVSVDTVDIATLGVTAAFTSSPNSGFSPLNVNFTNGSTNATSYSWTFGNGSTSTAVDPSSTYTASGTYTVMLVAMNNTCSDTAYDVIVVNDNSSIEIPNVFTPNGDGTNDIFFIKSVGIKDLTADIFNRWGDKLYVITGPNDSWDGRIMSGGHATNGTYFVILKATGYDGKEYNIQTHVGLFK